MGYAIYYRTYYSTQVSAEGDGMIEGHETEAVGDAGIPPAFSSASLRRAAG